MIDHVETTVTAVVSLVIRQPDSRSILLGVRRSTSTSARHPDVLSTITMRIPAAILTAALEEVGAAGLMPSFGESIHIDRAPELRFGEPDGFQYVATVLSESLMARKLDVADSLVQGLIGGSIRPLGIAAELVEDPKGGFGAERTVMLTYELMAERGASLFKPESASYSTIAWVDGARLGEALARNDALLLVPDADPFEVCIHGLCVRSAATFAKFGDD